MYIYRYICTYMYIYIYIYIYRQPFDALSPGSSCRIATLEGKSPTPAPVTPPPPREVQQQPQPQPAQKSKQDKAMCSHRACTQKHPAVETFLSQLASALGLSGGPPIADVQQIGSRLQAANAVSHVVCVYRHACET